MSLPLARDEDFFGPNRRPVAIDPQHLRVINDTALRSRLIMAGIAEGLQSPKGPQRIKSIIRLHPALGAPAPPPPAPHCATRPPGPPLGLPTVEELNALLGRIQQIERDVSRELQG